MIEAFIIIIIIIIMVVFVVLLLMVKCRLSMRMENLWNDTDGGKSEGFEENPIAVPVVQPARS
jgi:high-affinity Fe2+/Pb2+ permease